GGFGRGGMSNVRVTRDGRVFYQQGNGVYSAGGGGGGGGAPAAVGFGRRGGGGAPAAPTTGSTESATSGSSGRRVSFTVTLKIDKPAEWQEMFNDAWRTM